MTTYLERAARLYCERLHIDQGNLLDNRPGLTFAMTKLGELDLMLWCLEEAKNTKRKDQ